MLNLRPRFARCNETKFMKQEIYRQTARTRSDIYGFFINGRDGSELMVFQHLRAEARLSAGDRCRGNDMSYTRYGLTFNLILNVAFFYSERIVLQCF